MNQEISLERNFAIWDMIAGVNKLGESLINVVELNRRAHEPLRKEMWEACTDSTERAKFLRDFCTVSIRLPQRSGISSWASKSLTSEDLLITKCPTGQEKAVVIQHYNEVRSLRSSFVPRYIVLDQASQYGAAAIADIYFHVGKDPEKQTFIFIG